MPTSIEWTRGEDGTPGETWNPLRGCRRISPGCEHCYAERQAARPILSGPGLPYEGLVQFGRQGPRWTGATAGPDQLDVPLRWKKPRKVFPCSMSDLFFEGFSFERIAAVFGIMAATPQHTYQVLTKRIERARRFVEWAERAGADVAGPVDLCTIMARNHGSDLSDPQATRWPLPNVWIGTSIEDQQRADERLPHLHAVPAAVHFVSYEPALGPVDFRPWLKDCTSCRRRTIDWIIIGDSGEPGVDRPVRHGPEPRHVDGARFDGDSRLDGDDRAGPRLDVRHQQVECVGGRLERVDASRSGDSGEHGEAADAPTQVEHGGTGRDVPPVAGVVPVTPYLADHLDVVGIDPGGELDLGPVRGEVNQRGGRHGHRRCLSAMDRLDSSVPQLWDHMCSSNVHGPTSSPARALAR
jgi:protein gp37